MKFLADENIPLQVGLDKKIAKNYKRELEEIYKKLLAEYGYQGWWPLFNGKTGKIEYHQKDYILPKNDAQRFEICLGAILTQNTSWKNAEKALKNLRENNLLKRDKLILINSAKLAELIKSSGYNNQKAKKIKEFITFLDSGKEISRENLLSVWGVGRETADSMLLYAYQRPIFVIDAYTKRIFSRIGLCNENISYDNLQQIFQNNLDNNSQLFNEYHALLVEHGKRHCKKIPQCKSCPIKNNCSHYKKL